MLSMTTDYVTDKGCPEQYLKNIAEAGFTHVHWCHHWNSDFLYSYPEICQIAKWLADFKLELLDAHGSAGKEKSWYSPKEYEREAGVDLVRNRMDFALMLGSDVLIMHVPTAPTKPEDKLIFWNQIYRSLDSIEPYAGRIGVQIAIETLFPSNADTLDALFARYSPDFLGLCYDSGHGNINGDGFDILEKHGDRLLSLHLHDNDGKEDQHKIPFQGTLDWKRATELISRSAYTKGVSLEVVGIQRSGYDDEMEFLRESYRVATVLSEMIGNS